MRKRKEESPQRPNPRFDAELSPEVLAFFEARGIGAATLARNRVAQETLADGSKAIAFPYYRQAACGCGLCRVPAVLRPGIHPSRTSAGLALRVHAGTASW